MKKMIAICLIAVFFAISAYAEPCFKVRPEPPFVSHAALCSSEAVLWNQLGFNPKDLEGCWSRCSVTLPLKHTGKWFAESGAGFKTMSSFFNRSCCKRCRKTDFIEFKVGDVSLPPEEYDFIGTVNVKANKGFTSIVCLMHALKTAMNNGGDLAVLCVSGMNPIYHKSWSDIKLQGEAVVIMKVYSRNACVMLAPIEKIELPPDSKVGYYSFFAQDYGCCCKPQCCCSQPCCHSCRTCCRIPCRSCCCRNRCCK